MKVESVLLKITDGTFGGLLQPMIQCDCGALHGPLITGMRCERCGKAATPVYVDIEVREVDPNEVSEG
jgi:hypothetical protein|nr:MAG TPA: DNA-directed RNA polymerase subunit alpha [Caudoviricetes sp.]